MCKLFKTGGRFFTFSPINVSKNCCCTAFLRQPEMQKRRGRPEAPARRDVSFRHRPSKAISAPSSGRAAPALDRHIQKSPDRQGRNSSGQCPFQNSLCPCGSPPAQREPPAYPALFFHREALLQKAQFLSPGVHRLQGILCQLADAVTVQHIKIAGIDAPSASMTYCMVQCPSIPQASGSWPFSIHSRLSKYRWYCFRPAIAS